MSYLARMEGLVAAHGWAVQTVLPRVDDPAPGPPFAYTVGLSAPRFGHPELLVAGLLATTARTLLDELGERVRAGRRLHAGDRIADLLQGGYEVELVAVDDPDDVRMPLSIANRLYGHGHAVDALQVVWPDPNHHFPWDPDVDVDVRAVQPLLGRPMPHRP